MTIIYVTFDGLTDSLGQSQILPYILGLTKHSHKFIVVSLEKKHKYEQQKDAINRLITGHQISWVPLTYHNRPPIISSLYDFSLMRRKVKEICRTEPVHLLHCRSYQAGMIGLSIQRKFSIPYVFDMRGYWADERFDGGIWNRNNPIYRLIYRLLKKKEKQLLENAAHIVSLTKKSKEELATRKLNLPPVSVIPCSVNYQEHLPARPDSVAKIREELGISPSSLVIGYLGSLGTWYLLDEMLEFFSMLKQQYEESCFLFLTPEDPESILQAAAVHGIDKDYFRIQFVKKDQLPLYMSIADIGIFFIKPCFSKIASSPTKLGELFALGIPVIANSGVGDLDEQIKPPCGILVNNFSKAEYERVISEISIMLQTNSSRIREDTQGTFDISNAIATYSSIYQYSRQG